MDKKIGTIKDELKAALDSELPSFITEYQTDERAGVIKLVAQAKKRLHDLQVEMERIDS